METVPASIFIETYGCSFNAADEEAMAGVLEAAGYRIAAHPADADLIILNTCTVKDRTFLEFEKRLHALREDARLGTGPRLVVAGCIPRAYAGAGLLEGISTLGPDTIAQAPEVVAATLEGRVVQLVRGNGAAAGRPLLPSRRRNPAIEILPIARGCRSACAFCQTRLARGRLVSFRPGDLIERARRAIGEGARQIWLTAQDTGAYGAESGDITLPQLLGRLCALEGDFMIRLGMSSPHWIYARLAEYLDALAHPRMFQFLHVPVQSGSDAVLRAMHREGTAAEFIDIADAFHARFPDATLMTDIIAGFPGESAEDFAATLALLERAAPAAVNRSRFSARPATPAATLSPPPGRVVSERMALLNESARRLARAFHHRQLGRRERVLTAESPRPGRTIAHTRAWRPVDLAGEWPLGIWLDVEIHAAADYHLQGRVSPAAIIKRPGL